MSTDRDNFYDWARDKDKRSGDRTAFTTLGHADFFVSRPSRPTPWRRIVLAILLGIALLVTIRLLASA